MSESSRTLPREQNIFFKNKFLEMSYTVGPSKVLASNLLQKRIRVVVLKWIVRKFIRPSGRAQKPDPKIIDRIAFD